MTTKRNTTQSMFLMNTLGINIFNMIKTEQIKDAVEACSQLGHSIRVRDVAYVILRKFFEPAIAYKSIFGTEPENDSYDKSAAISFLSNYVDFNFIDSAEDKITKEERLSFEENKSEMLRIIEKIETAISNVSTDPKDYLTGLKQIADIRVKLNDKFNVQDDKRNQMVVVETKFNTICPYLHRECYINKDNEQK